MNPLRNHKSYLAAIGHRVSGIALALFLPFHFLLLGSALEGAQGLDRFLVYTDLSPVKVAEWGLVMMLSVHLFFGIRVLFLEFTRWPGHVNDLAGWVVPCSIAVLFVGTVFLIQVL
jgi:fumarate reductase subunit D